MGGFYTHKVKWYDNFNSTIRTNQGVTYASSYTGAMAQIKHHYGKNSIVESVLLYSHREITPDTDEEAIRYEAL